MADVFDRLVALLEAEKADFFKAKMQEYFVR